jgi:hypothetical protein
MATPDLDALGLDDLKKLLVEALERIAALTVENVALREEVARLKGHKGRPPIKPSGMAQSGGGAGPAGGGKRGRGGRPRSNRVIDTDIVLPAAVPPGSRFKGYEDFVVQDLVLRSRVVRYRRERWLTPDGRTIVATLPAGVRSHFGADLRRYVLAQYHQGQVTVPRLAAQLRAIGVAISKRQVVRLLNEGQDGFLGEARDVLRAGLETGAWVSVDDTGARHRGANGVCTQIGNDRFAWFATTGSKSRINFLGLLRAGYTDYVINAEALAYMQRQSMAGPVLACLAAHPDRQFADHDAWHAHLVRLGITAITAGPDPVKIATEGALWGSIKAHGFLVDGAIISDDAGQFAVGRHGLCWVHAERLVHKLDTFTDRQRQAQQRIRALIWWFYRDLLAYRQAPAASRRTALRLRFDRIFKRRTGFATLDRLLRRLHANKAELLLVLDHPVVPLHTNGSENDIRCQVTKRKISGGTRSDTGRDCRDAFLGLAKTCTKLGLSFWNYLGDRLGVAGINPVPALPDLVRAPAPA